MSTQRIALLPRLFACALLLVASSAEAEVLVVDAASGPGSDFADIGAAVAAAAPGDLILVRDGTYNGFTLDGKGVTITADAGALVYVGPSLLSVSAVRNVPAAETAVLRGLVFSSYWPIHSHFGTTLTVADCSGPVWLEDCSFLSGDPSLAIEQCSDVVLVRCSASGDGPHGGTAVTALGSAVYVQEAQIQGGDGQDGASGLAGAEVPSFPGGDGLRIAGGSLWLADSVLAGGQGGNGYTDFVLCVAPQDGGDALELGEGDPLARMASVVLAGGAAGATIPCAAPASSGLTLNVQSGTAQTLGSPTPSLTLTPVAREGEDVSASVNGSAGYDAFLGLSLALQAQYVDPLLKSALLLGLPVTVEFLGPISMAGSSPTLTVQMQDLGPGIESAVVGVQSLACDFTAGTCTLGTASTLVVLDAAF